MDQLVGLLVLLLDMHSLCQRSVSLLASVMVASRYEPSIFVYVNYLLFGKPTMKGTVKMIIRHK